jgi:hypothetical protein
VNEPQGRDEPDRQALRLTVAGALALTLFFALLAYVLLEASLSSGTVSLTFLIVLPATLSAFAALTSDPYGRRGFAHYLIVPAMLAILAFAAGLLLLREGAICVIILAPLWLMAGVVGSAAVYLLRRRLRGGPPTSYCAALLLLPMLSAQLESELSTPVQWRSVDREVTIDASPEKVWPLLLSIPAIGPGEGRWNFAQDVLGIPRPTEALLKARGGEAVRIARWGDIRFEEAITGLRPGEALEWRFRFPDASLRENTDRHIDPHGAHLKVESGGYRLRPAPGGGTLVTLTTRYALRSPVNHYAGWWGDRLLGDIQDNVLAIVRDRAEAGS